MLMRENLHLGKVHQNAVVLKLSQCADLHLYQKQLLTDFTMLELQKGSCDMID